MASAASEAVVPGLDSSPADLDQRIRANTHEWLLRQFDGRDGAFHGFYAVPQRRFEPPQTVNLIAPWQLLAAYDRYREDRLLDMARQAAEWFYAHFVVTHPMSVVIGGVREGARPHELWTKFAAEFVLLCTGLSRRTEEAGWLDRARQSAQFLIQSARHGFAPCFDEQAGEWRRSGWQSFGRSVEAFLAMSFTAV